MPDGPTRYGEGGNYLGDVLAIGEGEWAMWGHGTPGKKGEPPPPPSLPARTHAGDSGPPRFTSTYGERIASRSSYLRSFLFPGLLHIASGDGALLIIPSLPSCPAPLPSPLAPTTPPPPHPRPPHSPCAGGPHELCNLVSPPPFLTGPPPPLGARRSPGAGGPHGTSAQRGLFA